MDDSNEANFLKLRAITILRMLSFDKIRLSFNEYALFIEGNAEHSAARNVSFAIKLMLSGKFATFESLPWEIMLSPGTIMLEFYRPKAKKDCVSEAMIKHMVEGIEEEFEELDYTPSTSAQAYWREFARKEVKVERIERAKYTNYNIISVTRDFRERFAGVIKMCINDGYEIYLPIGRFHSCFKTTINYLLPYFNENISEIKWVEQISTNSDETEHWDDHPQNPLARFISQMVKKERVPPHMHMLTNALLESVIKLDEAEKECAIQVFGDVRTIFELLTGGKYTVWFNIVVDGEIKDILYVPSHCVDLTNVRTFIQSRGSNSSWGVMWQSMPEGIKTIFLIAFQLTLAYHLDLPVVFIDNIETVEEMQSVETMTNVTLHTLSDVEQSFASKNYIQRIIDVCNSMKKQLIVLLKGAVHYDLKNVDIMSTYRFDDTDWLLTIRRMDSSEIKNFMHLLAEKITKRLNSEENSETTTDSDASDEESDIKDDQNGHETDESDKETGAGDANPKQYNENIDSEEIVVELNPLDITFTDEHEK